MKITSGNKTVDKMWEINFSGNIIPEMWYKNILRENGKPYLTAIIILAEIVYWYRPEIIRDPDTGVMTGIRKKFKDDALRRNYAQLSKKFGISEREATNAVVALEKLGLVTRDLRMVVNEDGRKESNVLYLHANADRIKSITFMDEERKNKVKYMPAKSDRSHKIKGEGITIKSDTSDKINAYTIAEKSDICDPEEVGDITTISDLYNNNTNINNNIENTKEINQSINNGKTLKEEKKDRVKERYTFVLDPTVQLKEGTIRFVKNELKQKQGIDEEWIDDPEFMFEVVQVLCEWNSNTDPEYEPDDRWKREVYLLAVEALAEMLTEQEMKKYSGANVSSEKVVSQVNKIYRNNGGSIAEVDFFLSMVVDRFIELEKEKRIKNKKLYMKSLIWSSFSTYFCDWQGYFFRSYFNKMKE